MEQSERLHMPLFSIRIVKELTGLTPRQIRYYETHGL
nr:MerR family transcriptional regulator [Geomicrobium sp. JCM 19037]